MIEEFENKWAHGNRISIDSKFTSKANLHQNTSNDKLNMTKK